MVRRSTFLLAAMAIAVLLPVQACWACSCMAGTPEEYWEWATVVFDGNPTDRSEPNASGTVTWTFEVVEAWKGTDAATIEVTSFADSAACGLEFELGTTYRVYASESEAALATNLCSGTGAVDAFDGPPAPDGGEDPATGGGSSGQAPDAPDDPNADGDPDAPVTGRPDNATDMPTTVATPLAGPPGGEIAVDAGADRSTLVPVVLVGAGVGLLGLVVFLVRRSSG